jgi:L-threonylcarbamoyladenylate synthase
MDIDYIIKGDDSSITFGIESTVVAVDGNKCTILRPGVITSDDIQNCLPEYSVHTPEKNTKLISPGLLQSHYSPLKPLYFLDNKNMPDTKAGYIRHQKNEFDFYHENTIFTSLTGNLLEVAANLFGALHQMEENKNVDTIYVERTSNEGIGRAIMDRLNKATFQYQQK